MPRVHLCYGIVQYIVSQTINHLRNRACAHKSTHTSIYRTLCWSLTLLYTVVMATPLREDTQAATLVKSARLSFTSLSVFHTHTPSFSFNASHFCLSNSTAFPSSDFVLFLLSLHHSWCTSLPACLQYCYLFIFSPPMSQVNVNMSSHFSNPHCVNISDFRLASTHTFWGHLCLVVCLCV